MTSENGIYIKNIYHMLSYAFRALKRTTYEEIEAEPFENLFELLSVILAKGVARHLKQGLYRTYEAKIEDIALVRGRIDFQGTIINKMRQSQRLCCQYDELSTNNLYNQIIKTTMALLVREPSVREEYRAPLKKALLFLSEVDTIQPKSIVWNRLQYHRSNENYRMLLNICYFILNDLLLTTEEGKYKLMGFLDDQSMARLFEKFVLHYYQRHYPAYGAGASEIKWDVENGEDVFLPAMQTDVTLRDKTHNRTLIIDTKFYGKSMQYNALYDNRTYHSGNLYQIYTYVKNESARNAGIVSGMLLYAKTQESITPDSDLLIGENRISVKTLDLNVPFANIAKQLDGFIIAWQMKEAVVS